MGGHTIHDRIRKENIGHKVRIASTVAKMVESCFRCGFDMHGERLIEAPINR